MIYEALAKACRERVEAALETSVPESVEEPLRGAMRYALLAPGKRLRPMLLLQAHEMLAPADDEAMRFATALEMIHAYSLVHDDLPAMDNDTLRRGRPTCHIAYGEAMAILAGDGLLSLAFETMLSSRHPRALQAAQAIAEQAGVVGMVGGQALDVAHEGQAPDRALIERMQTGKTAALFRAAIRAGLILAGADDVQLAAGSDYALGLGRAFQIIDDLLDLTGDVRQLGKTPGKDEAEGKLTWPAAVGIEQAREDARQWTEFAVKALEPFGPASDFLRETALRALTRIS